MNKYDYFWWLAILILADSSQNKQLLNGYVKFGY